MQELIEAPDLEALGTVLDARLHAYVGRGVPADERCASEHEVRRYLTRTHERAIAEKHYRGPRPWFVCIDPENLAPLPRDAFDDEELLTLLKQPMFTGCKNRMHVWRPGGYFVRSHIYWGFLICILTGMRPGEVGQLKCADIRTDGEFFYFDLRPFDARNGRVAIKDLHNLKTNAAGRVIPIYPLLIELGLLDRMQDLMDQGELRLFPEWEAYTRKDGTIRWSQPLSKAWQYVKTILARELSEMRRRAAPTISMDRLGAMRDSTGSAGYMLPFAPFMIHF